MLWVCREEAVADTLDTTLAPPEDITEVTEVTNTGENIKLLQITPTSIQVQFPDITGGNLMYIETERLAGRRDPPWENAILVEGGL